MTEALWSIDELAEYLGVPARTIYAWRYKRLGPPALRLGKHLRFRREDVEAWLAEQSADLSGVRGTVVGRPKEVKDGRR